MKKILLSSFLILYPIVLISGVLMLVGGAAINVSTGWGEENKITV